MKFKHLPKHQKIILTLLFILMISQFLQFSHHYLLDLAIDTQDHLYISSARYYLFGPKVLILQKYDADGHKL